MTKNEAHQLLRVVRLGYGASVPEAAITRALQVTGDLPTPLDALGLTLPMPSFLNRSGRVMRGAGDVVREVVA